MRDKPRQASTKANPLTTEHFKSVYRLHLVIEQLAYPVRFPPAKRVTLAARGAQTPHSAAQQPKAVIGMKIAL